jgi:glutamate formiminotransferase/formiminotetrahydrofolate cyclodeaminase
VEAAVQSLGLDDLKPFVAADRVIEYRGAKPGPLVSMTLREFADETSTESPAPGGGSVAALCGGLAASLTAMVAALTHAKKGMEDRRESMDRTARAAQEHKDAFLQAIDDDTAAFNRVMDAIRLPRKTEEQKAARQQAMEEANKGATAIPLQVLGRCVEILPLIAEAASRGNPASLSDAGVAAVTASAAAEGAYMNVRINLSGIDDVACRDESHSEADRLLAEVRAAVAEIREQVLASLS